MFQLKQDLKKTPLYDKHVEAGAKMVPFSGWDMPVQYSGIIEEHMHTRTKVSIFDICHMGEFFLRGAAAERTVDRLVTCRIKGMPDGKCRYGFLLNEDGGIKDDLIVFKMSSEEFMLVVNAGTIIKDRAWIRAKVPLNADFSDETDQIAKLDVQGPLSGDVMSKIAGKDIVDNLKRYTFTTVEIDGIKTILSRTGYTGECGYELFFPKEKAIYLWDKLMAFQEVMPVGLGARDTLRLEMGYSLYGNEINEETIPIEAGLERFVDIEKGFIGKEAILKKINSGIKRRLTGFICEGRRSARSHFSVMIEDNIVGEVTSGAFSPCMQKGIGLCYIDKYNATDGNEIILTDGKIEIKANIKSAPMYEKC